MWHVHPHNWVHDNIEFLPTYGSIQGSDLTLQVKRGNAFDTASLLIALLRAAGVPARYVYGTIEIPIDKVKNWVGGAQDSQAALDLLGQGGVPILGLAQAGKIVAARMEHAWGRFDGVTSPLNVAVSTYQYGRGKSVYMGYRALAEATAAGAGNLHAALLGDALGYITPSFANVSAQEVVPLHLVLTNKGVATPGQVQLPLPSGVTLVDPGSAKFSNGLLTWSFNLAQAQELTFDAWVRLPNAAGPVAFDALVQTGTTGAFVDYKHAKLTLSTIALATLADAKALAATDRYFVPIALWLNTAQFWLDHNRPDFAQVTLLHATDLLIVCPSARSSDLRLEVDDVIWAVSRSLE